MSKVISRVVTVPLPLGEEPCTVVVTRNSVARRVPLTSANQVEKGTRVVEERFVIYLSEDNRVASCTNITHIVETVISGPSGVDTVHFSDGGEIQIPFPLRQAKKGTLEACKWMVEKITIN